MISKEAISRLARDVKDLVKNPLHDSGIYYKHDDTDMLSGYAMIIGPPDTPYHGGYYFFKINFPVDYPHVPPKVLFCTTSPNVRFNPNLYANGKVCLSILNTWFGDSWSSCDTLRTILLQLCLVFTENPLMNEPGVHAIHRDCNPYRRAIEFVNIDAAIINIITKKPGYYESFFDLFYSIIQDHFSKRYNDIVRFIQDKGPGTEIVRIRMYDMIVEIDYPNLLIKIENI